MPHLHLTAADGYRFSPVETTCTTIEEAVREKEGMVGDQSYYDSVIKWLHEPVVIGSRLALINRETQELYMVAALTDDPVPPPGEWMYVPQSFISWEVRKYEEVVN